MLLLIWSSNDLPQSKNETEETKCQFRALTLSSIKHSSKPADNKRRIKYWKSRTAPANPQNCHEKYSLYLVTTALSGATQPHLALIIQNAAVSLALKQ